MKREGLLPAIILMTMKVKVELFSGGCPELIREQGTPELVCKVDQQIPAPAPTLHTAEVQFKLSVKLCNMHSSEIFEVVRKSHKNFWTT